HSSSSYSAPSLHDALPISRRRAELYLLSITVVWGSTFVITKSLLEDNSPLFYTAIRFLLGSLILLVLSPRRLTKISRSTLKRGRDRKSTRLNSSHGSISYA